MSLFLSPSFCPPLPASLSLLCLSFLHALKQEILVTPSPLTSVKHYLSPVYELPNSFSLRLHLLTLLSIFPTSPPTGLTLQMKRPNPQKYRIPPKVTTQIQTRGNSSDPWTGESDPKAVIQVLWDNEDLNTVSF